MLFAFALAVLPTAAFFEEPVLGRIPADHEIVPGTLRVARDGSRVACVVEKGEKQFPLVGSELGAAFDSVWEPVLHPSGKHVAFRVTKFTSRNATCSVLYDGKSIVTDDWISSIALDPVTGAPAYWVSSGWINNADGSLSHGPMGIRFGKAKGKSWVFGSSHQAPSFPDEGGSVIAVGTKGGATTLFRLDSKGREERIEHDAEVPVEAVFSPDGREFAYTYIMNANRAPHSKADLLFGVRRERIEGRDKKESPADESAGYESGGSPVFSADGVHLAFRARVGDKYAAVLNREADVKFEFDFIDDIRISPQNAKLAYRAAIDCEIEGDRDDGLLHGTIATGGQWYIVHGDERTDDYDAVGAPVWSPDGTKCAYAVKMKKGWYVIGGDKASAPYAEVSPLLWSEDGHSIQFAGVVGSEIRYVSVASK